MSPGGAAVSSLGNQRKGGFGDRIRGSSQIELPLPTALLAASLVGTLRVLEEVESSSLGRGTGVL